MTAGRVAPGSDMTDTNLPPDDGSEAGPEVRVHDSSRGISTPRTLKKRREFLAAARARRWATPALVLQARERRPDEADEGVRVGYTCSKKVGGAVERNRAKRRLRAVASEVIPRHGRPGWDYVLIGRSDTTASRPFPLLIADLETALERVHRPPKPGSGQRPGKTR